MKKKIILSAMALMTLFTKAQVPNNSFENLNADGGIKNWGMIFITTVTFDSLGNSHSDSLIFDGQLYFATPDAHSGNVALEMRNAYNYTANWQIASNVRLQEDSNDYSFSNLLPITQRPTQFSFYYKFLPAGQDTAFAYMAVFDSLGTQIGESRIEIFNAVSVYSLTSKAINYFGTGSAAFISIEFSTAKPNSPATLGTHFLVDDVNLLITDIALNSLPEKELRCFPNPVENELTVQLDENLLREKADVEIADVSGKMIRRFYFWGEESEININTGDLKAGIYLLTLQINNQTYHAKFVR